MNMPAKKLRDADGAPVGLAVGATEGLAVGEVDGLELGPDGEPHNIDDGACPFFQQFSTLLPPALHAHPADPETSHFGGHFYNDLH